MTTIKLSDNVKKIGILSDTHAYLDERIKETLQDCDVILHAGDIMANEILEQLANLSAQVICVAGNNDVETVWPKKHKDIVNAIPEHVELEINQQKLAMIHGHQYGMAQPDHEKLRQAFEDARVIIYGHTHKQVIDNSQTPWVINPGAAGKIRTQGGPACLVLNIEEQNWQIQTIKFVDRQAAA